MFYKIIRTIVYPFFWLYFKPKYVRKYSKDDINGKLIVMSNHVSLWDPILLAIVFPRKLFFMAKKELFKVKLFGGLLKALGAFPVDRKKADVSAIKRSFEVLKQDNVMGIFPEGTRIKTGELGEFENGLSSIAMKAKAPIIPVYIDGRYGIFKRTRICFGDKIVLNDIFVDKNSYTIEDVTKYLKDSVESLKQITEANRTRNK